jgi:hypothetical protein
LDIVAVGWAFQKNPGLMFAWADGYHGANAELYLVGIYWSWQTAPKGFE